MRIYDNKYKKKKKRMSKMNQKLTKAKKRVIFEPGD
jgi:hypothetical protein